MLPWIIYPKYCPNDDDDGVDDAGGGYGGDGDDDGGCGVGTSHSVVHKHLDIAPFNHDVICALG